MRRGEVARERTCEVVRGWICQVGAAWRAWPDRLVVLVERSTRNHAAAICFR